MESHVLNEIDAQDIVTGATLLGGGGGGPPYVGRLMALQAVHDGRVRLIDAQKIPDEAFTVVSFGMGSPVAHNEKWLDVQLIRAAKALSSFLRKRFQAIVAFEQGGGNTPAAMYTAANLGLPLVDGDGVGRAVPELQMTTFDLHHIPISPMAVADEADRVSILQVKNAYIAERLARAITVEYGFLAGAAAYPMSAKMLKQAVVPGTMRLALKIGRTLRESRLEQKDPVEAILQVARGRLLIRGTVQQVTSQTVKGFDFGSTSIKGEDEWTGQMLRVDFKNENMIAWKDGQVVAMVPDLICILDELRGEPLTNVDVQAGLRVAVLALPASAKVRTQAGFEMFRHVLRSLGYEGGFRRLEEVK